MKCKYLDKDSGIYCNNDEVNKVCCNQIEKKVIDCKYYKKVKE